MPYNNLTLSSSNGDIVITVYLPNGVDAGANSPDNLYYYSSRFEHGSMIGNIQIRRPQSSSTSNDDDDAAQAPSPPQYHTLYGTNLWRIPHNSNWPESGVGLASEFGVGDEGDFCYYRCGWSQASDITNGVLGYKRARAGEAFLKVGVGALIKGTCPACDSTEDYKFNSPYMFAEPPQWKLTKLSKRGGGSSSGGANSIYGITLEHQAALRPEHGYKLQKQMVLVQDNVLEVTTTLTNLGTLPFSTVWYSHNFFSCDDRAVGPGYAVDMDLTLQNDRASDDHYIDQLYSEPGTWSWSTPLLEYGRIVAARAADVVFGSSDYEDGNTRNIRVEMDRTVDPGIRIKSEFVPQPNSQGAFVLEACRTRIQNTFRMNTPQENKFDMYAYNLYLERGTFSPEPQMLFHFAAGETKSWTQRLEFETLESEDDDKETTTTEPSDNPDVSWLTASLRRPLSHQKTQRHSSSSWRTEMTQSSTMTVGACWFVIVLCSCYIVLMVVTKLNNKSSQRRLQYTRIENVVDGEEDYEDNTDDGRQQYGYQKQQEQQQ
mmetsp:Transcript_5336/g.15044  ORF Transcript_5336/g.15044 Transcript_5336/m.15044 type:complete len:544 (-) Transcript_5336:333-1964(-)